MGFHKISPTRNMRLPHAHLDRKESGDVYGVLKLGFKKDSPMFRYCFIGSNIGTLTYKECIIAKHPKFKGLDAFERKMVYPICCRARNLIITNKIRL